MGGGSNERDYQGASEGSGILRRGECAFLDDWGFECKLGSCPVDWDLDDIGDAAEDTSGKGV